MGIGPSTKETSLHHFRDPLLEVVAEDTDLEDVYKRQAPVIAMCRRRLACAQLISQERFIVWKNFLKRSKREECVRCITKMVNTIW